MLLTQKDYRTYLKTVLAERISRNPKYSLRSFARQLGLHHSMLVQVFQNKKNLSVDRGHVLAQRLDLAGKEYEYFCLLIEIDNAKTSEQKAILINRIRDLHPTSEIRDLSVDHFQIISEWYHLPVRHLTESTNYKFTPEIIAKRLGITKIEAELAVERLERLELIEKDETGEYKKTESRVLAKSATPQEAIRKFHKQMFLKTIDSLTEQTNQEKWVGSETFAFDPELLPQANQLIEQFFDRMIQLSSQSTKRDDVYHLNTAFFRLTQKTGGTDEKH